jgi:hypothetical protein
MGSKGNSCSRRAFLKTTAAGLVMPAPLVVQAMLFTKAEPTESWGEISARYVPGLYVSQSLLYAVLFATVTWPLLKTWMPLPPLW